MKIFFFFNYVNVTNIRGNLISRMPPKLKKKISEIEFNSEIL